MVDASLPNAGQQAEMLALNYLKAQGLRPLTQNFHCRFGEIDLIMREKDAIIFVEVKYRRSRHFGGGLAAITPAKQRKLKLAASYYLQRYQQHSDSPCRFDALVIEGNLSYPRYQWITHILQ